MKDLIFAGLLIIAGAILVAATEITMVAWECFWAFH